MIRAGGLLLAASASVIARQAPPAPRPFTLVWVDRSGNEQPLSAPARPYANPRISPDGRRLAVTIEGPQDVWVCDLPACAVLTQFTTLGTSNDIATWAPGGRLAYRSNTLGSQNAFWQTAEGTTGREQIAPLATFAQQPPRRRALPPDSRASCSTVSTARRNCRIRTRADESR